MTTTRYSEPSRPDCVTRISMNRSVFLDRDGVLNQLIVRDGHRCPPSKAADVQLMPGVSTALRCLKDAGFVLIGITNQPDVARGTTTRECVDAINRHICTVLRLDGVRACFHDDTDGCACRKPAPGMILAEAVQRDIRLSQSFVIGDGWRDIAAGRAAGCATILVHSERSAKPRISPDYFAASMDDAATWILSRTPRPSTTDPYNSSSLKVFDSSDAPFVRGYLLEVAQILRLLNDDLIQALAARLADLRARDGRLFLLGVGGSAATCSHAVNDFRRVGIEAYAAVDNVSELTARVNDDGWETVFASWLLGCRLKPSDMVFVFSVGGGSIDPSVSPNLVRALEYARMVGTPVVGVVGRDGGYTAKVADACVVIPTVNPETMTPHAEAFQTVVLHLLVSHPLLKTAPSKWESVR